MHLKDFHIDQGTCMRCSSCKFTEFYHAKRGETLYGCPSIHKYNFHAYSGSGKLHVGFSINEEHTKLDEAAADVAYKCTLCGSCDFACKTFFKYIDVGENIEALRIACVDEGYGLPEHAEMIKSMKSKGNTLKKSKASRIKWTENAKIKTLDGGETGKVMFHSGCMYGYDKKLTKRLTGLVNVLSDAGVDLITAGTDETCCGGKAIQLGYIDAGKAAAKALMAKLEKSGAKKIVTPCAHCYSAFKYYYPKHGIDLGVEVLHTSELLCRLVESGDLVLNALKPINVTYHDPCNLGRRSEPPKPEFKGDKKLRPMELTRTGELGIYDEPRNIIKAIPDVNLVEMDRIREYAYCCGAGAGVEEANPDLKEFAGRERIKEAAFTGTSTIVTACPWCEESLKSAARQEGIDLKVIDLTDLVIKSAGGDA